MRSFVFVVVAMVATSCDANAVKEATAAVQDPRLASDRDREDACRQVGRDVQADAGGDASTTMQGVAFDAYCNCTVDAGLRSTCVGVTP